MTLEKILALCEKHGFVQAIKKNNADVIKIGPVGALLQENLRNEWFFGMVTNRDMMVFMNNHSFKETFQYAREICSEKVPFAIAEMINKKCSENKENNESKNGIFNKYFKAEDNIILHCTNFVSPENSTPFFHKWQRQRRIWWRKFSASPGRYTLTDIQSEDNGNHSVQIKSEYPWGTQLLETIKLSTEKHEEVSAQQLQLKDGRKKVRAHYVTSNICFSTLLLNTLCDCYEEPLFKGEKRKLLRLHRKIAPFKISFAISSSLSQKTEELNQLALYLCKQLRANHISCVLLPNAHRDSLEQQWIHYDELGIPYNILLNENTLKNGVILLRNRDTTLKEQVHISEVENYVQLLFKNY